MRNRRKLAIVFATGLFLGAILAASIVSWKWNRDFERWQAIGVGGQAFTAGEIYAGRSDEVAARILESLPVYLADMDRQDPEPSSIRLVVGWVGAAYDESGTPMPTEVVEILQRWETAAN